MRRAALVLALLQGCSSGSPPASAADQDMVRVPATRFTLGTSDAHPDLPKTPAGTLPLHPSELVVARADSAWRLADERPAHPVRLSAFAIDRHEVTNAEYRRFLETGATTHQRCHPSEPKNKDHAPRYWKRFNPLLADPQYAKTAPVSEQTFRADDGPVVGVDWFDAYAYAAWAGKRLPTEAEWELACRGPNGSRWPWGDDWRWGVANVGGERHGADVPARGFDKDGFIYPAKVGSFPGGRSALGCDDLAGNAAEWVSDWYAADAYATGPEVDPRGPREGTQRVVRGGSSQSAPSQVRCSARAAREPEFRTFTLGFRCARDL
jgi:formylglycine-generating enzyme required for sulfatase activity